eukprot:515206-Alexandrium_andersonii.AAC.1
MHFLPYHPDDPRLATTARLDKPEYDASLFVDSDTVSFSRALSSLRLRTDTSLPRAGSPRSVSVVLSLRRCPGPVSASGAVAGGGIRRWRMWSG